MWRSNVTKGETYRIVRFYRDRAAPLNRETVVEGLTLQQAQRHCQDIETSSMTCTNEAGKRRTRDYGAWFDGYEKED
jgi:hypothetical protein